MSSDFKDQITELLKNIVDSANMTLSVPPKPEMGDLSFACFDVAKVWKMSPVEAAKKIVSVIARSSDPESEQRSNLKNNGIA